MSRHRHHRIKLRSVYVWHRYVGVSVALFVLMLVTTGILLNHTADLDLDQRHIHSRWLLAWYGIRAPQQVQAYTAQGHWLSQWENQIYVDHRRLDTPPGGALRGVIATAGMLVAAWPDSVLLLTPQGERIERLDSAAGLPADIQAIGLQADRVVLRTARGWYRADTELLNWQAYVPAEPAPAIAWSRPAALPSSLHESIVRSYLGAGLSLERVVQDIHSGRILGRWGVWLIDAAAVLMGFLALSGVWLWSMRWWRERQRHPARPRQHTK